VGLREGHGYAQAATWGKHVFSGATLVDSVRQGCRHFTLLWLAELFRWNDCSSVIDWAEDWSQVSEMRCMQSFGSFDHHSFKWHFTFNHDPMH